MPTLSSFHAPSSRWIAAPIHLVLSLLIIGGIAAAVVALWFPSGLYRAANLGKLFEVMLAVDVAVGPLLTLLVYKQGKRGLKLDLSVIALLQLAFLGYGLNTLWQGRPLFLVGSSEAFALVFANELPSGVTKDAEAKGWRRFHGTGPWLVGVDTTAPAVRDTFLESWLSGAAGPLQDPQRYLPYEKVAADVLRAAHPSEFGKAGLDSPSLPLMSARRTAVMLLDPATGQPLRAIP